MKISTKGEGVKGMTQQVQLSTNYGFGCLLIAKIYFPMHQRPILQLVDNCRSGIVTFPLYRNFPGIAINIVQLGFFRDELLTDELS